MMRPELVWRRKLAALLLPLLLIALVSGCGSASSAKQAAGGDKAQGKTSEPKLVRFGSVGGLTDAGVYIADARGFFTEAGIKVERVRINSAPDLTTAVATGQVEVAGISVSPGLYNSLNKGIKLRIVGDKQSIRPGMSATQLVARTNLVVKGDVRATMQALKGKKLAISAKPSSVYKILADLAAKHGMALADFSIVEMAYGDMTAAVANGAVDAAILLEPFLSTMVKSGAVAVVSDLTEVLPQEGVTIVPLVYDETFAVKNRDSAQAFMNAYMRGVRVYNDAFTKGKEKEQVIDIIAKYAEVDKSIVEKAFVAGLHPDQQVNTDYLEKLQAFFVDQGYVTKPVDIKGIMDPSFAQNAVKALGGEYGK